MANKRCLSISNFNMKSVFIKILLFTGILLCSIILFWSLLSLTRRETCRLPNDENIVFLGNSHCEFGINDELIPNSFNFGINAERPQFVYAKTKLLKKYNPQIDTVFICYDNMLLFHGSTASFTDDIMHSYYYDMYDWEDIRHMLKFGSFEYLTSYFAYTFSAQKLYSIFKAFYRDVNVREMKDIGGGQKLYRDALELAIESQNDVVTKSRCDSLSLYFMDKTIEFCQENNVQVIFLYPPQHYQYKSDTITYKQIYNTHFSQVPMYDCRTLQLPDSCFSDLTHLNYLGADQFTAYIKNNILCY